MENTNNKKSDAALREEKVLEFWRENKIFAKSLEQTKKGKDFVFYEGPPTANAKPALHHLEARAFKDAIPRYKTMQGYHVRRKAGWDTHGLPVELQVEKKLGLNSKKAIEEYGVAKFNKECRESVWEYVDVWNKFTERSGYWVDQENPYVTYHNDYIESVWNVVKEVAKQKLLYKDYKVVPWCPRCGTALSSHELAQGYEDVKDLSITAKFKIIGFDKAYFLAWTTTPWTLPGNIALAVGKDIVYVEAKVKDEILVLAKDRLSIITEKYEIIAEHKGSEMVGMSYEPLFPYLKEQLEKKGESVEKAFKVYVADFVNTEDGTGIVHTAVMYGQDDFELGTKVGLPKHHLVDPEGKFIKGTGFLEGRYVKEEKDGKPTMTVDIIKDLQERNLFFSKENYTHSYPHCWRCKTALIYYARDSWYIKVSDPKIKTKLIEENKKITWEPAYTREGRFGEWLREIKDWAISRERYWGTPLPVWTCEKCEKRHVIGSLEDLKKKTKKSGNKYFVMRHGEATNHTTGVWTRDTHHNGVLTDKGKEQIKESTKKLKEKVDLVISSPFSRAKESAEIACAELKLTINSILYDERAREWEVDFSFEGKPDTEIDQYYGRYYSEDPKKSFTDGENFAELIKRVGDFIYDLEKKYQNKNILISSHDGVGRALEFIALGYTFEKLKEEGPLQYLQNAEIRPVSFIPLPHNSQYELDYHRPYIDEVKLVCDCGGDMKRVKEVMDVWLDSGCVPFAQDHYPFSTKKILYPADFICEAIDQTRGWFYTLHAVGVLMGRGKAYKNVICLGHLLDATGKKMSKSLGNIVDPWEAMDKYGADTLRLWMYSVNQPGESKNFDEKTVALLSQQVFGLLYNVLAFYELYRDKKQETNDRPKSKNILDQWIMTRLDELAKLTTENLDNYKLLEPTRAMKDFVGDLSTWYLRRSRERIKENDKDAKQTLYFTLKTLAKIMAPFAPFAAEDIWLKLKNSDDAESVHLTSWPKVEKVNSRIIEEMLITREIVSLGLEARQKLKIQVRQPLQSIFIKDKNFERIEKNDQLLELIKDELNIKDIIFDHSANKEVKSIALDPHITPELKQEGNYRELLRAIQDLRKKQGLLPKDKIKLTLPSKYQELAKKFEADLKKAVVAHEIEFKDQEEIIIQ